jgi:hypothetical protein
MKNTTELTKENAKNFLVIINKDHPEWGYWTMNFGKNGWEIRNSAGDSKMLDESEFHFWWFYTI